MSEGRKKRRPGGHTVTVGESGVMDILCDREFFLGASGSGNERERDTAGLELVGGLSGTVGRGERKCCGEGGRFRRTGAVLSCETGTVDGSLAIVTCREEMIISL